MALIDYEQIEEDAEATANLWNERFGQIIDEINGNLDASNIEAGSLTSSLFASDVMERMYPVGSVYINASNSANPNTYLGFGSWAAFATGRVLVGIDVGQTEFNTILKTGGSKSLQEHTHGISGYGTTGDDSSGGQYAVTADSSLGSVRNITTDSSGEGDSQNLQPYITVYMWQRTA